jgi:hypothetical protein
MGERIRKQEEPPTASQEAVLRKDTDVPALQELFRSMATITVLDPKTKSGGILVRITASDELLITSVLARATGNSAVQGPEQARRHSHWHHSQLFDTLGVQGV